MTSSADNIKRARALCFIVLSALLFSPTFAWANDRVALVVGISEYQNTQNLSNPRNDADAIAAALQRTGFEVTLEHDLNRLEFENALYDFGLKAQTSELALVFYAGHGLQVNGKNYLMPTDAQLRYLRDLRRMIDVDTVISEAGLARQLGIVILDACRDNPLASAFEKTRSADARNALVGRGLSRVKSAPSNTLIAFATADNATAADGSGQHSPYTTALLQHIERPGLDVRLLLGHVRDTVIKLTNGQQEPYIYGSLGGGQIYLSQALSEDAKFGLQACQAYLDTDQLDKALSCQQQLSARYPNSKATATLLGHIIQAYETKTEQAALQTEQALTSISQAESQVRHYLTQLSALDPENAKIAQTEQQLNASFASSELSHIANPPALTRLQQEKQSLAQQHEKLQQENQSLTQQHEKLQQENQSLAQQQQQLQQQLITLRETKPQAIGLSRSGELLRDPLLSGGSGPELVAIKGACFLMGNPAQNAPKDERPHEVCINDFYLGKYEITVAEFGRFVKATAYRTDAERTGGCRVLRQARWQVVQGYHWQNPGYTQTEQHPAVCLSAQDAQVYLHWLSEQTRSYYRLPSEAEWEYAARAGTQTRFYWGETIQNSYQYANVADQSSLQHYKQWENTLDCSDQYIFAAPVGTFQANAWGIHDMLGNALEWTCSAFDTSYQGGEQRCAYQHSERVLRGGSWLDRAETLRIAFRNHDKVDQPYFISGFRVARPVPVLGQESGQEPGQESDQ